MNVTRYLNRLSDYFFMAARYAIAPNARTPANTPTRGSEVPVRSSPETRCVVTEGVCGTAVGFVHAFERSMRLHLNEQDRRTRAGERGGCLPEEETLGPTALCGFRYERVHNHEAETDVSLCYEVPVQFRNTFSLNFAH